MNARSTAPQSLRKKSKRGRQIEEDTASCVRACAPCRNQGRGRSRLRATATGTSSRHPSSVSTWNVRPSTFASWRHPVIMRRWQSKIGVPVVGRDRKRPYHHAGIGPEILFYNIKRSILGDACSPLPLTPDECGEQAIGKRFVGTLLE